MTETKRKSLEPTVLQVKEGTEPVLVGSKCPRCLRVFFPARLWCANCLEPLCEPVELSREGKLASFALVERKQDYSLVGPPYILGEVNLPEGLDIYTTVNLKSEVTENGVRIYSTVDEKNFDTLIMGQKVILKPVVIKKEGDSEIIAYNFQTV